MYCASMRTTGMLIAFLELPGAVANGIPARAYHLSGRAKGKSPTFGYSGGASFEVEK
jgi:hypothetical protein